MSVQHVSRRYSRFASPLRLTARADIAEALSPSVTHAERQDSAGNFAPSHTAGVSVEHARPIAAVEQKRLSETDQITAELITPTLSVSDTRAKMVEVDGEDDDAGASNLIPVVVLHEGDTCMTALTAATASSARGRGRSHSSGSSCRASWRGSGSDNPFKEDAEDEIPPQCMLLASAVDPGEGTARRPPRRWRSVRSDDSSLHQAVCCPKEPLASLTTPPHTDATSTRTGECRSGLSERRRRRPVTWRIGRGTAVRSPSLDSAFTPRLLRPSSPAGLRCERRDGRRATAIPRTRPASREGVTPSSSRRLSVSAGSSAPDCRRHTRVPRPSATGAECEGSWASVGSPGTLYRVQSGRHVVVSSIMTHDSLLRGTPPRRRSAWSPIRPYNWPLHSFATPTADSEQHNDEDGVLNVGQVPRSNAFALTRRGHGDKDCHTGQAKVVRWTRYDDEDEEEGEANKHSRRSSSATLRHDTVACPRASKPFHALTLCDLKQGEETPCSLSLSTVCMTSSFDARHYTPSRHNTAHYGRVASHVRSTSQSPCRPGTQFEDSWGDDEVVHLGDTHPQ